MPYFKMSCTHEYDECDEIFANNKASFNCEQLEDVLGFMQDFLRGCGYNSLGSLEFVEHPPHYIGDCASKKAPCQSNSECDCN